MIIDEQAAALPLLSQIPQRLIPRAGEPEEGTVPLLNEHTLTVAVNGRSAMELVCVPQYLPELVLGRLLTEGAIRGPEDVALLRLRQGGRLAEVTLNRAYPAPPPRPGVLSPIPWQSEWVFRLADRFAQGMPLHAATWSTHSCFLAREGALLFSCEDIGRHNALDKVIGYALRTGVPLDRCMVYSSGRIPTDMAWKAICAGIPVLVSKAAPTAQAVSLAERHGLTLICSARRDSMRLFCG